MEYTYVEERSL